MRGTCPRCGAHGLTPDETQKSAPHVAEDGRSRLDDDALSVSSGSASSAIGRALDLVQPARLQLRDGYLDLRGDQDPTDSHPSQRLMARRVLPLIYERLWRPLGGRLLMGAIGPGVSGEHRIALAWTPPSRSGFCEMATAGGSGPH